MKYVYLLSVIALLSSCKTIKTSNCSPYNIIEITHWGTDETDKKNFILYEYDTLNVFLKTIDINEIRVYNKTTDPNYYGSMRIFLKTPLCPDRNYKLIISDSLQYNIQEMDMISFYKRALYLTKKNNLIKIMLVRYSKTLARTARTLGKVNY